MSVKIMEKFDLKKGKMIRHPYDKSEVSLKKKNWPQRKTVIYIIYLCSQRKERL